MRIPPARRPSTRVDPDTFPDSSLCSLRSAARFFGLLRNACDDSLSPIILAAQRDGSVFSETKDDRHKVTRAHARVDWKNAPIRRSRPPAWLRSAPLPDGSTSQDTRSIASPHRERQAQRHRRAAAGPRESLSRTYQARSGLVSRDAGKGEWSLSAAQDMMACKSAAARNRELRCGSRTALAFR